MGGITGSGPTGKPGYMYYNENNHVPYFSNGNSFVSMGPISGTITLTAVNNAPLLPPILYTLTISNSLTLLPGWAVFNNNFTYNPLDTQIPFVFDGSPNAIVIATFGHNTSCTLMPIIATGTSSTNKIIKFLNNTSAAQDLGTTMTSVGQVLQIHIMIAMNP